DHARNSFRRLASGQRDLLQGVVIMCDDEATSPTQLVVCPNCRGASAHFPNMHCEQCHDQGLIKDPSNRGEAMTALSPENQATVNRIGMIMLDYSGREIGILNTIMTAVRNE